MFVKIFNILSFDKKNDVLEIDQIDSSLYHDKNIHSIIKFIFTYCYEYLNIKNLQIVIEDKTTQSYEIGSIHLNDIILSDLTENTYSESEFDCRSDDQTINGLIDNLKDLFADESSITSDLNKISSDEEHFIHKFHNDFTHENESKFIFMFSSDELHPLLIVN